MSALVVPIGAIDVGEIARIVLLTRLRQIFNLQALSYSERRFSSFSRRGKKTKKRSDFSGRIYVLRFCSFPLPLASCLFTTIFARQATTQRRTILSESGVLTGAAGTDVSTKKTSKILNWFCSKTRPFVYRAFLDG